jgi:hypothetical protein
MSDSCAIPMGNACTGYQRRRKALKSIAITAIVAIPRMFSQVLHPIGLRRVHSGRRTILSVTISLLGAAAWTPSEAVPPGIYEISTQTLMPHLEENLRYARTLERRCIRDHGLSDFFPILRQQSLNGCKLAAGNRRGNAIYYPLVCDGSNGTTGTAQLHADVDGIKGVLEIKMGGKNMTFSQRIEAKRQGDCDSQP